MTTKVRILVADDHAVMREGLRMIINAQRDLAVVGECDNGATALRLVRELHPDVAIMDLAMPEGSGLEVMQRLTESKTDTKVLVLTQHTDRAYVQRVLQLGAKGYVLKRSGSEELLRAIHVVAVGQTYLDPAIADKAVDTSSGRRTSGDAPLHANLTTREEDVLRLVAWGLLSKEIAARLEISIKTVETHKANAMIKLGLHSRVDVVRYAVLAGWLHAS